MIKVAILASGSGSNAKQITQYFKGHPYIQIDSIFSNNIDAYVLVRQDISDIERNYVANKEMKNGSLLDELKNRNIDYVILAGFLRKISDEIIASFPNRILNIHPALLPKFGGKGMYGQYVHRAVYDAKEKISGITIHFVNEQYDKGQVVFQACCDISSCSTASEVGTKVLSLEHAYYPKIINQVISRNFVLNECLSK